MPVSKQKDANRSLKAQLKLQKGTYNYTGQELHWSYYDTQVLRSNILSHTYFNQGKGKQFTYSTAGTKSLADSNVLSEGIPQGQALIVDKIGVFYQSADVKAATEIQDVVAMFQETVLTVKVENIDRLFQATLQEITGLTLPLEENGGGNMLNIPWKYYMLKNPIPLSALTTFDIQLEHFVAPAAAVQDDKLKISLVGELFRLN